MKEILKGYKYEMRPTKDQKILLNKHFGATRWVYNFFLNRMQEQYKRLGKSDGKYENSKYLTEMKKMPEYAWLNEVNDRALREAINQLDDAWKNFFKKKKGRPNFKVYGINESYTSFYNNYIRDNKIMTNKFREGIRFVKHRELPEGSDIRLMTFSKTPTGRYYVSVTVKEQYVPREKTGRVCGVDLGLTHLMVLSNGDTIENNRYLNKYLKKLARLQRLQSRKKKGSVAYNRLKQKIAEVHEKIRFCRQDYNHKISRRMVNEYDIVCTETLNVKGMMSRKNKKNHRGLRRGISDVAWGELVRQMDYKAAWDNNRVIKIAQKFPSTKTCNVCGDKNDNLSLTDRTWVCNNGHELNRDLNAAVNILNEGLKQLEETA